MSNRIQPTHFIEVWSPRNGTGITCIQFINYRIVKKIYNTPSKLTIALFLIRPKTPQEQATSKYYPTMLPTSMSETSK